MKAQAEETEDEGHRRGLTRRHVITGGAGIAGTAAIAAATGAYVKFLTPSADLRDYSDYLINDQRSLHAGEVRVTFLGTTTLLVDDGATQLLFDAFISDVSLGTAIFGEVQSDTAKVDATLSLVGADRVEGIFISHSHYDHVLDAPHIARRTGAVLHGSASTLNVGRGGGVSETQLQKYQVGEPIRFGDFTVTVLASKHSPGTKGGDGTPITHPLRQPAKAGDYLEGGSYDFHVAHGAHSILVKASAGYLPGALDGVQADAMFCGTAGSMGKDADFRLAFYEQAVAKVAPRIFVPLHWNNFFQPVTNHLSANMRAIDDVAASWDFLIEKFDSTHTEFALLEGFSSIILFGATGRAT